MPGGPGVEGKAASRAPERAHPKVRERGAQGANAAIGVRPAGYPLGSTMMVTSGVMPEKTLMATL